MKLKFTTKLFIVCCLVSVILRTVQIVFLTEAERCYLKPGHTLLNILIYAVPLLLLTYTAANAALSTRRPRCPGNNGWLQFAVCLVSGMIFAASGTVGFSKGDLSTIGLILSLASSLYFVLLAASSVSGFYLPKISTLFPIFYWVYVLVTSYLRYTEHSLRVRTAVSVLASASALLFFSCLGKVFCSVDSDKNYRILYPLGIVTAVFCLTSVAPEFIASVIGYKDSVSECFISEATLFATGVFSTSVTLSTFKRSNTVRRTENSDTV